MQNFMTEFQIKKISKSMCSFIKIAQRAAMFICGKKTTRKNHARKGDRAEKSCAEVSARKCQRGNVVRGSVGQSIFTRPYFA